MNLKTIDDLYYGNIVPSDICITTNKTLFELSNETNQIADEIENALGDKKDLINKYIDLMHKQYDELLKLSFEDGFSLGLKLTYESLNKK